jgi:outer membrane cobalamin receptor
LIKPVLLVSSLIVLATGTFASPDQRSTEQNTYVWVTGSRIPQKVKVKPLGTNTANHLSVWTRREIDQTGRQTTEGVLAQDPSLTIRLGRAGAGF